MNSEGINMLTNKKSISEKWVRFGKLENADTSYFTITEIELWGVTFKE